MRGVHSAIDDLRREVFAEVARLAYEGGDYSRIDEIPYKIEERRAGDIATCYADPAKAAEVLGWKADRTLDVMCADSCRWQTQNPDGYAE